MLFQSVGRSVFVEVMERCASLSLLHMAIELTDHQLEVGTVLDPVAGPGVLVAILRLNYAGNVGEDCGAIAVLVGDVRARLDWADGDFCNSHFDTAR